MTRDTTLLICGLIFAAVLLPMLAIDHASLATWLAAITGIVLLLWPWLERLLHRIACGLLDRITWAFDKFWHH